MAPALRIYMGDLGTEGKCTPPHKVPFSQSFMETGSLPADTHTPPLSKEKLNTA